MAAPPADEVSGEIQVRPFAAFLQEQSGGRSHDELSDGLRELVERVQDTGKKGSIAYKVSVEAMKGDMTALVISDEIKLTLPEHDRAASVFFADEHHNLTRHDPRQIQLPLREVGDTYERNAR